MMTALSALREECRQVSEVVLALSEEDFGRPTRCTDWNMKELLAHMRRSMARLDTALREPAPAEAPCDPLTYWHRHAEAGSEGLISDQAREIAAGFATGLDLAGAWDETWKDAVSAAERAEPGRIVPIYGMALELEGYLGTRVLDICVHRMDLEDALGRKCRVTDEAVAIVEQILVGLFGREPPAALGWDAVDFIETACGRRALTEEERGILGSQIAEGFPLIR